MRPFPYRPGDSGQPITDWQSWFNRAYTFYAPPVTGVYDAASVAATKELQRRLQLSQTGNFNIQTAKKAGFIQTPIFVSVEGHASNLFFGPVADTGTQLEGEGLCHHQPIGYENGAIPFNNQSGVDEVNRIFSLDELDGAWGQKIAFPVGTPIVLAGFSQGMIVVYDFLEQYTGPRKDDFLCFLFYGNPCRATNSGGTDGTHGLDPYKRFGLAGCVPQPSNAFEVWRKGDIFAQDTDDLKGQLKASIYQVVARGDFFSNPYGLVSELLTQFGALASADYFELLTFGIGVVQAIISGIGFLADNPNPHYSPYDIEPGKAFVRNFLA